MDRDTLIQVITSTIGDGERGYDASDVDVPGIADELLRDRPDGHFESLDPNEFWPVVERHRR